MADSAPGGPPEVVMPTEGDWAGVERTTPSQPGSAPPPSDPQSDSESPSGIPSTVRPAINMQHHIAVCSTSPNPWICPVELSNVVLLLDAEQPTGEDEQMQPGRLGRRRVEFLESQLGRKQGYEITNLPKQNGGEEEDAEDLRIRAQGPHPDNTYVCYDEELGSGAYKTVYRGSNLEEGFEVAWNELKVSVFFLFCTITSAIWPF